MYIILFDYSLQKYTKYKCVYTCTTCLEINLDSTSLNQTTCPLTMSLCGRRHTIIVHAYIHKILYDARHIYPQQKSELNNR